MIKAFRIDERLIHGQVIATWLKTLGTTHLIVADDEEGGQGNGAPSLRVVQIFTHSLVAAVPAAASFRNLVNLPIQYRTG